MAEQLSGAATCQQQCPEWLQSLQSPQRMSSALAERICLYEGTLESWWKEVLALLSRAVREAVSVSRAATDLCISALFIFLHSLQGKHRGRQRHPCVLQDHRRRCNHPQLQIIPLNFPKPKFHFPWSWYITNTTDRPTLCSVCMPVCIYIYIETYMLFFFCMSLSWKTVTVMYNCLCSDVLQRYFLGFYCLWPLYLCFIAA